MAKQERGPTLEFKIKLSDETVQKLAEEAKTIDPQPSTQDSVELCDDNVKLDKIPSSEKTIDEPSINVKAEPPNTPIGVSTISEGTKSDKSEVSKKNNSEIKPNESWGEYASYISYEGEETVYTDPTSQQKYTWNQSNNAWDPKTCEVPGRVYSYENDTHIYTDADGSKYFWDDAKKAWIPKVDDEFLAYYQMSYGFVDNTTKEEKNSKDIKVENDSEEDKKEEIDSKDDKKEPTAVKRKNEPQWFEASDVNNTKVYVSNLPLDLTEEEFVNFMQKCGLVERDPKTQKMKVKLYMDKEQNCFKGDALCTYIKIESVDLALKLLDGYILNGSKVKVERAHFQLKGEYNPALKPKKKKKKELETIKKMQQKLFDWRPEKFIGERSKHERVVIVKNLFHPTDFDKDVQLILDYQQDLREECARSGEVRKVVIYDRHPEGVAQISMKSPEEADAVVQLINGRWFGKRQITAEIWDGRTKYRIAETDSEISKRTEKWDEFLGGKGDGNKDSKDNATIANSEKPNNDGGSDVKPAEITVSPSETLKS